MEDNGVRIPRYEAGIGLSTSRLMVVVAEAATPRRQENGSQMRAYLTVVWVLLSVASASAANSLDPGRELRRHLRGTMWQWDGAGGEVVVFADDGYMRHEGWTDRHLVTRWDVIDRRTVLLTVESGRAQDLYSILVFNEDMTSFDGFNFHGETRLEASTQLGGTTAGCGARGPRGAPARPDHAGAGRRGGTGYWR